MFRASSTAVMRNLVTSCWWWWLRTAALPLTHSPTYID